MTRRTHTRKARGFKVIVIAMALVGTTAASCSSATDEPATPTTTDVAPSTTQPKTTPPEVDEETATATTSPEEEAVEQTRPLIEQYVQLVDQTSQDPQGTDLKILEGAMISSALNDHTNRLAAMQTQGIVQKGTTEIVSVSEPKVDLANETVEYLVCTDVSGIEIVNSEGQSTTNPDRVDRALVRMGVSNFEYPDPDQWKVGFTEWQEGEKC